MLESSKQPSKFISRADLRKRIYAFFVTSGAVFVVACLIWPLSVTGFRSVAEINVLAGSDLESAAQLEQMLGYAVRNETEDSCLESIVSEIGAAGKLRSEQIEYLDHLSIKNAIKFGVKKTNQAYQLSVVYDGEGGEDERALVEILSARVANRLAVETSKRWDVDTSLENLEQANWIVDQIENDLDLVKSSLNQLATNPTQLPSQNGTQLHGSGSRFHQASSSKIVSPGFDGLEQTIASIDVQSLRSILDELEQQVAGRNGTLDANCEPDGSNTGISVTGLSACRTIPIRGVPGFGVLLALGAFAGLVGTVIAGHYEPFESRGFSGVQAVGKMLGVPVVATIKATDSPGTADKLTDGHGTCWANRVVKTAGLLLLGIFVVVAGFVLINPEVRQAFFENPFFGCAKIVRIFIGY